MPCSYLAFQTSGAILFLLKAMSFENTVHGEDKWTTLGLRCSIMMLTSLLMHLLLQS